MIATSQDTGALELIRRDYGTRWDILHTSDEWHAVRRDPRPDLRGLSATTARALLADLEHVEGANR